MEKPQKPVFLGVRCLHLLRQHNMVRDYSLAAGGKHGLELFNHVACRHDKSVSCRLDACTLRGENKVAFES